MYEINKEGRMDKWKLIDRIINDNQGINPEGAIWHIPLGGGSEYLFGEKEFNKRAKELGWINGYKYGVEYETNGKMPDLPFDLIVEVFYERLPPWQKERVSDALWHSNAYKPIKFRIVDERYKPKQPESQSKPIVEINGYELLELLDSLNDKEMFEFQKSQEAKALHTALIKLRKQKSEREILIDIITSAGNLSEGMLADAILAAGFTNNKENK